MGAVVVQRQMDIEAGSDIGVNALQSFKHRCNQRWLVSKHDYVTPSQARTLLTLESAE